MIKMLVSSIPDEPEPGVRYERAENASPGWNTTVAGWFRCSHEGLVLATGEHNWHDDSDFYAVVWDAEAGEPREVGYASTRGWTYANSATVDATPEIIGAYATWRHTMIDAQLAREAAAEAATPRAGKTVRVVKGRKVPVGTVAEVTWYGEGRSYRRHAPVPMRVGLMVGGERVFTDASNVEVVTAENSGMRESWAPGDTAWFEYRCLESDDSGDAELWYRSHQAVTITGRGEDEDAGGTLTERCEGGVPNCYGIRFADGFEHCAVEDELLTGPEWYERPDPPARTR